MYYKNYRGKKDLEKEENLYKNSLQVVITRANVYENKL